MNRTPLTLFLAAPALALTGCATTAGPVEVTRFVSPAASGQLAHGAITLETAPGTADDLENAPYKAAVAAQLERLGYRISDHAEAGQVAQVTVERHLQLAEQARRNPVSVGVGGSTGSYGSGVGLGVGINLGGGPRNRIATRLSVMIRDKGTGASLWEGRADLAVKDNSPLADRTRNAQTLATALFRDFPGNNGETVEVKVK